MMEVGGNARAKAFFAQHGVGDTVKDTDKKYRRSAIREIECYFRELIRVERARSRAAELYRAQLKREVYEPTAAASTGGDFTEEQVETPEQRRAAAQKAKIDSAVAAAKASVAAAAPAVQPLRVEEASGGEMILARKAAVSKTQTLGATKAAANAFDDFDKDDDDEHQQQASAAGGGGGGASRTASGTNVTRSDLAAAAEAAAGAPDGAASTRAASKSDDKPKGR
jgi:hypothetical protein